MNHPRQKNFLHGPGDAKPPRLSDYSPDFRDMCLTLAAVLVFVLVWVALP